MARGPQREGKAGKRRLEAVAAALGAALAVATLGVILWFGLSDEGRPPSISVSARDAEPVAHGFVLPIQAFNGGDAAAAGVTVSAALVQDGATVETSEATFDYLPSRSERRGGLFFEHDPRRYTLDLRAEGYVEP